MTTLGTPLSAARHPRPAARLGRAGQGSGDRAAAPRRGGDRRRPLRRRAGHAGRASLARARHARPGGAARADRAGEAAPRRARDRGHPHARRWWSWSAKGLRRHPDRARGAPDDGPRRHPPAGGRDAGLADLALPLRRHARGVPRRGRRDRPAVRGQAGDVVLGQGPEHAAHRGRHRRGVGLRADRRPRRRRARASSRASSTSTTRSPC